jgi:GNAT superfamily N-acetyltransferase
VRERREEQRVGLDALAVATTLLQRARRAHPTKGLYEAADLQWWWRMPRPTDDLPQLFWFDHLDRPEAAAITVDGGERVALVPIVMPDAPAEWVAHVVDRGLAYAGECGFGAVEVEVERADDVMLAVLAAHGFTREGDGVVETWMDSAARPEVSPQPDGYRSATRLDMVARPHHMIGRSGPAVEARLRETSLYRADLDLLVLDDRDEVVAHGLFWYDPETATGLVEPMRTEDDHQRRGLARHLLTTGVDLLAAAGAARTKICFRPDNPASRGLYLSVGFAPVKQTDVLIGRERA